MKKLVFGSLATVLATVGFSWGNALMPIATSSLNSTAQAASPKKPQYRPFSKRGQVTGAAPGGKRGTCKDAQVLPGDKLVAIAPSDSTGASLSTKPTIWIYSPYTFPANKFKQPIQGEFKVRASSEAGGQLGESVMVDLPMKPGLVKVPMTQAVKDGQSYDWSFTAKCGDASANPMTASRIQIANDAKLVSANQSLSQQQQSANYADKGYWYDALTLTLQAQPIVESDLENLLQSGGLKAIAEKLRMK
jgi:hypothetical protein